MNKSASLPARHLKVADLACIRGERRIFTDLAFGLNPGEALLLKGANGAGKTTLLCCLAGFIHPASGKIAFEGRDPETRPGADLHFVGHQPALKPGLSAAENLAFWARLNGGEVARVETALDEAGIGHAAALDTALLSAGQTRRLSLARLLVAPRPIWLLDEPTAALDNTGAAWVKSLIENHLSAGGIAIAATHLPLGLEKQKKVKTLTLGAPS